MTRKFTVEKSSIGESGGRYISETPSAAAKKAASRLFAKKTDLKPIKFTLRETTRGSSKPVYEYTASKEKLKNPSTRIIKDKNGNEKKIENKYIIKLQ